MKVQHVVFILDGMNEATGKEIKVNRQRPAASVRQRPELKISTLAKWLISPSICVIIKICKTNLVLKTNGNIYVYSET